LVWLIKRKLNNDLNKKKYQILTISKNYQILGVEPIFTEFFISIILYFSYEIFKNLKLLNLAKKIKRNPLTIFATLIKTLKKAFQ
jgi:hypothetical protein